MQTASDIELDELYRNAAKVTAHGSKSFFFATRFFPPHLSRSAHAVYWFCRYTEDLVDEAPDADEARHQLEEWAYWVERGLQGEPADHPILKVFLDAVDKHEIPPQYPLELLEGMRMDLRGQRYQNFEELHTYCYRVASVVGLMMSHVIGFTGPAEGYAIDLGVAMQLTNILRDMGEDLKRSRIYLPSDEMERFGYLESDLREMRRNEEFFALMKFQLERARQFYQRSMPGIAMLHPDGRFAVKVAADMYRHILNRIEESGYDVFAQRAVVPARTKYWLTAKSMALPIAKHSIGKLAFWRGA